MSNRGGQRRALFLDRDGVVNEEVRYLHRVADCRFVDGVFAMAAAFAAQGFLIVIATNQSGIGRGYFSEAEFDKLMAWMRGEFAARGVTLAAVYHCPDHPTEGLGAYRRDNPWRKPGPGMLLQAAIDFDLDMARSWSVGDKPSDVAAARAAGVGHVVHLDPQADAVRREADHWVVPRLAVVAALLDRDP